MLDQEITKTILEGKVITRAVLYARVSSDDTKKDGRNLQGQLDMGREYAQGKGYRIVAELAEDDRGASGASIDLPQLSKIRDMAQRSEFDVLIVREIDRLSRNLAKQLIIEEELNRAGVSIEYVLADYEDSPEGRLSKHVRATVAEYEREKIKERMIRGKRNKVKAGSVMVNGRPPYGYIAVEKNGLWALEIDPDTAKIVKLIFQWYTVGDGENGPMSLRGIAIKLSRMGIPTAADLNTNIPKKNDKRANWHKSTIWKMLKCKTYIGEWRYSKTIKTNGKQRKNPTGGTRPVEVPAIIDAETWELAQERLAKNKQESKRNRKYDYLLAGHCICGKCGLRMSGFPVRSGGKLNLYYFCPATKKHNGRAHKCDLPYFRLDVIESATWDWVKQVISNPEYLKEKLIEYQTQQDQIQKPLRERLEIVNDLLSQNRAQLERLLDLYLSGDMPKEMLIDRKNRLETTIANLEKEQRTSQERLGENTVTPELIEEVLEFSQVVREAADSMDDDFEQKRWLLERLKVEVRLTIEDGERAAYASCCLEEKQEKPLGIASTSTDINRHNIQMFILTTRLILK